jgi:DNA-directed RNA polymerase subunit RPC12/RpoP
MFVVVRCYQCGELLLAKGESRSRRCPYCNTKLKLSKVQILGESKVATEAITLLKELRETTVARRIQDISSQR